MAIPNTAELEALLQGSTDRVLAELQPHFAPQVIFLWGQYSARISKRTQVNSAQKAVEFLQALSSHHRIPVQASGGALASRFEVVGDVLMLPEQYLTGPQWEAILGLETTTSTAGVTTSVAETDAVSQYRRQVFGTLAQCFGLHRVARKAEIDSGPKRESKVRLLHPVLGMPATTGPGSPGWVTVFENKIGFSFDIARVMFCSGNVTERMRMGRQASQGDVVVDFYCGIGYYTVPLLVHGGARHVHAYEWNPNSVLALRDNLRRAGVSDRCTVYEGDNKISADTWENLYNLADRVNLGLLPSSVTGWELAARALKPSGGIIHVHENVLESILDTWVEETRQTFETMLRACGKELKVSIVHLERVKSYAPRVYHVVLDLSCVA
jgi:tRNA G37 N-methylase Trm5